MDKLIITRYYDNMEYYKKKFKEFLFSLSSRYFLRIGFFFLFYLLEYLQSISSQFKRGQIEIDNDIKYRHKI